MEKFLALLKASLAFKSVSTDPEFRSEVEACGAWLATQMQAHGFSVQSITGFGNPLIYGHYVVDPALPTYLIYGHYDVQPAALEDGWASDPFVLRDDGERLYARGVADNKGQHLIHLATIFDLIEQQKLRYNIKVLIEWDEETGSPYMVNFFEQYKELLACDGVIISDGEIIGHSTPTMTESFRGGANMTLTIQTANTDVHSGMYGNILPSASHTLLQLLTHLYDEKWLIAIPWWYDSVAPIDQTTIANNLTIPFDTQALFQATGAKGTVVPAWYDAMTANGLLPTIQVSGLSSGYTGTGYKNIIPAKAIGKMNFRFAPGQDAKEMITMFTKWVEKTVPSYATFSIDTSDPYNAIALSTDSDRVQTCREALAAAYNTPVIIRHCGAAVPISGLFQTYVGCPVAVVDFANEDCNMHGIDENFCIENIEKWLRCSELLFGKK